MTAVSGLSRVRDVAIQMHKFPEAASHEIAMLEGFILATMLDRYSRMGETESGLYEYYTARFLKARVGLSHYERGILEFFRTGNLVRPEHIIHAGSGVGSLTFALAKLGFTITGVERDQRRLRAAEELRFRLTQLYPEIGSRSALVEGDFPVAVEQLLAPSTFLVFTNVGSGWSRELEDAILAVMRRCGGALFDLRLFGRMRETEVERQDLRERVQAIVQAPLEAVTAGETTTYAYWALQTSLPRIADRLHNASPTGNSDHA